MPYHSTILLLAIIGSATAASLMPAEAQLSNSLQASLDMSDTADPSTVADCFNKYLPMLNDIASEFSKQYQQCITIADEATKALLDAAANNRTEFVKETTDICDAFKKCDDETDNLDFFNCYSEAATDDVSVIYGLSSNASNVATTLTQGLQAIQIERTHCTSDAEHTYVTDTSSTYTKLNSCFVDGLSSSSTTERPSGSTEATKTTDEESTTVEAVPVTTEAPK